MDRPTTAQLVAIAVAVLLFVALVVGLAVLGGDDQQAVTSGSVSNTPPTSALIDPTTAPEAISVLTVVTETPTTTSTGPPSCETIPTLSLGGPDASVEMSLVVFACGEYNAHGEAMFDPAYVPEQPVVASGTVSLEVEPSGSIAIAVAPWEPGMTWAMLEPDVPLDPSPDGSYVIELPTTGCSAIVASLRLEPGEGRFIGLAESALGACSAAG